MLNQLPTRAKLRKIHLAVLSAAALTLGTITVSAHAATIADWTFETTGVAQPPASAAVISGTVSGGGTFTGTGGTITPESGAGTASAFHFGTSAYTAPAGNGSAHSFSSTNWVTNDYYEFDVNTTSFTGVTLTFDQNGSGTGPRDFKVETSTDNGTSWVNLASGAYSLPDVTGVSSSGATTTGAITWSSGTAITNTTFTFDLSAISGLTGVRLVDTDTTSIVGGTVGSSGTDRVDNVVISGTPEPATAGLVLAGAAFIVGRGRRR